METGARVLVFPLACALVAIAAPVIWMVTSRVRQRCLVAATAASSPGSSTPCA
jgi:hypothetical protein